MTLAEYLRIVRRNWLLIAVTAVLGVAGATAFTIAATPQYRATTQVFVSTQGGGGGLGDLIQGSNFTQQRVKSYADLVTSPRALQPVVDDLGLSSTADQLAGQVQATSVPETVLIEISVTDPDPTRARDIANAISTAFPQLVAELETPTGEAKSPIKVSPTRAAVTPTEPISPRTRLNVLVGLILGLLLGLGLAVLRSNLDRSVKSKDDAQRVAQAPVLTVVENDPEAEQHRLITHDPFSPRAEAFRQLRTNIGFLSVDHAVRSFVVTSSLAAEGKTSTACNLAIALAEAGENVVLIDADLRRPSIADVFTLSGGVGLTSVLLGDLPVDDALQPWRDDLPLRVLTAGPIPPNPSELIGSARMAALIDSLTGAGVTVVLDSPPLLPVTDAALLARASDGALVVTRAASTHAEQLAGACEALRIAGAAVLGVVLNRVPRRRGSSYYGRYAAAGDRSPQQPVQRSDGAAPRPPVPNAIGLEQLPGVRLIADPIPPLDPVAPPATRVISLSPMDAPRTEEPAEQTQRRRPRRLADPDPEPATRRAMPAMPDISTPRAVPVARDDMVIDADLFSISQLDPTNDDLLVPGSWHIEWGDLPALIAAPRDVHDPTIGQPAVRARHRN